MKVLLSKGKGSDPRLDDAVWPGYNCAVATFIEDELKNEICKAANNLLGKLGGTGFAMFELPVNRVI